MRESDEKAPVKAAAVKAVAGILVLAGVALLAYQAGRRGKPEIPTYGTIAPQTGLPALSRTAPAFIPQMQPPPPADDGADPAVTGDRYFESGRFLEAAAFYKKAVEKNPKDADSLNDLGLAYHYTGDAKAAVESLRKAVRANPKYQVAWLSLGFVLTHQDKLAEANEALKKCIAIDGDSPQALEAKKFLFNNLSRGGE